uniref:SHSP domain-containing protein n=2 Tax=Aegilops tauschii subsp. strangulata TaxID=200361 RepID=A0A453R4T9_AEGTS
FRRRSQGCRAAQPPQEAARQAVRVGCARVLCAPSRRRHRRSPPVQHPGQGGPSLRRRRLLLLLQRRERQRVRGHRLRRPPPRPRLLHPQLLSGRAGQFGAHTSLGRLLSALEDAAAPTGLSSTAGASRLGRWVAKVDDDAVYLKVPMPGLGKEHVKVWAEPNGLVIKGEGDKEPWDGDDDSAVPRYSRRIKVPADAFKMDKIKAEMKNGVLRVTLPRLKEEERKDVFQVKIE